jgi:hypothetical protein
VKVTKFIVGFAIVTLLLAISTEPWPGPVMNLDQLTAEANLIVVGQATLVEEVARTTVEFGDRIFAARAMTVELRVDKILKGSMKGSPLSLQFHFSLPDQFIGWRSVTPLSYRVFFLTESSGELKMTNPYFPSVPALEGAALQEGAPIERVIDQLGAVLLSPKASVDQKQEATFALSRTQDPAAIRALTQASDQKDMRLRASAAAALLEHNDISTLQFAEDNLLQPAPTLSPELLHNLCYAISDGVKDGRAVPSLTRLLRASNVEARRAAASALMHTGSKSSIDALLSALSDSDTEVRYYSVVGLAEITGQADWRPNMEDFASDPKKYLDHWREFSLTR